MSQETAISLLTTFFAEQKKKERNKKQEIEKGREREKEIKRNERTRLLLRISRQTLNLK